MIKTKVNPPLEQVARPFRKDRKKTIGLALESLTIRVRDNIRNEAPEMSGNLRKAIVDRRLNILTYQITIDKRRKGAKYERAIRLGIPAEKMNPILPKRKKALFWPGLPHPIRRVDEHPGIKPNPYFDRGIEASQPDIKRTEEELGIKIKTELLDERSS